MAMDSLLASLWPGPAPAPAPAEEERVFSYWDAPSDNTAAAPAAPAVDIDVYDEARLAPRPVQRAGSYDTDDLTDAELAAYRGADEASLPGLFLPAVLGLYPLQLRLDLPVYALRLPPKRHLTFPPAL